GGVGYALAANDALTAVGSSGGTALLFVNGKVVDLEGALALFDRLHWTLAEATGINANCEIVGWGNHDGSTRAFKLSPRPGFRCATVRGNARNGGDEGEATMEKTTRLASVVLVGALPALVMGASCRDPLEPAASRAGGALISDPASDGVEPQAPTRL